MRFRLATRDDAAQLARMRWAFREEVGEVPMQSAAEFAERYVQFLDSGLTSGHWTYWVAEDSARIVAHMAVHIVRSVPRPARRRDAWGYLTDCYTWPDHRGRGIGGELLAHVRGWAAAADLELLIVSPSDRSRAFYARAGFAPDDEFLLLRLRDYDAPDARDADRTPDGER